MGFLGLGGRGSISQHERCWGSKYPELLSEGQPYVACHSMPVVAPQVTPGSMANKDGGGCVLSLTSGCQEQQLKIPSHLQGHEVRIYPSQDNNTKYSC